MNKVTRSIAKEGSFRLPPGPPGTLLPTLALIRNPRLAFQGWVQKYGDPFLMKAINGPVVVTGREDLIKVIHGQDPAIYSPFATGTIVPLMGSGSMLVLEGEQHRRERRLMMPMFHGDRMKAYGQSMQEVAIRRLDAYRPLETIATLPLMTDISLEIIVRTIFGGSDQQQVTRLMDASRTVVAGSSPILFFSKRTHFSFLGISPWDRWKKARQQLNECLNQIIESRLRTRATSDDILSMLCEATYEDGQPISREHIYSELMTFLFAGHETTALTLAWAMYHLHKHPNSLQSLRQELDQLPDDSPTNLTSAPYLKAVTQETLRLNPIVTETLRKLNAPMTLGDYALPAGIAVAPATVLAHYNPNTYPDPDRFSPERFLDKSYSPFQYMPFGGGHRRCIGAAFATYETAIVLGTLLKRFQFELVDSNEVVPRRRNVTMGPSSDIPVRYLGNR